MWFYLKHDIWRFFCCICFPIYIVLIICCLISVFSLLNIICIKGQCLGKSWRSTQAPNGDCSCLTIEYSYTKVIMLFMIGLYCLGFYTTIIFWSDVLDVSYSGEGTQRLIDFHTEVVGPGCKPSGLFTQATDALK